MAKHSIDELDQGQLEMMWNFMKLNPRNICIKNDVKALRQNLEVIRQAMVQKTGGNRNNNPTGYVDFDDLGTYINDVVVAALWLHINGGLDILEKNLPENQGTNEDES